MEQATSAFETLNEQTHGTIGTMHNSAAIHEQRPAARCRTAGCGGAAGQTPPPPCGERRARGRDVTRVTRPAAKTGGSRLELAPSALRLSLAAAARAVWLAAPTLAHSSSVPPPLRSSRSPRRPGQLAVQI